MFRANFCPSSGAQDWGFYNIWYSVLLDWFLQKPVKQLPSYRTRSDRLPRSEPLPTTTTGHYTICCKNLSLTLLNMDKFYPKHVKLILEINTTLIVVSLWFLYYLT